MPDQAPCRSRDYRARLLLWRVRARPSELEGRDNCGLRGILLVGNGRGPVLSVMPRHQYPGQRRFSAIQRLPPNNPHQLPMSSKTGPKLVAAVESQNRFQQNSSAAPEFHFLDRSESALSSTGHCVGCNPSSQQLFPGQTLRAGWRRRRGLQR